MRESPEPALIIAPSLLAADFGRLNEEVAAIGRAGADWLHLDVMDGHFVPNISFGPLVIKALRPHSGLIFDLHLMIAPVDAYLADFAAAGADHITVHAEAGPHLHRSLQAIRALGKKAGVAINPATPIDAIANVLDLIDIINVMTVNPGFGGQRFLSSQLPKIAALRRMVAASGRAIHIETDGGIDPDSAPAARAAGADVLIAGSAIFGKPDYATAIAALRPAATAAPRPTATAASRSNS